MFSSDKTLDFTQSAVQAYIAVDYNQAVNYAILERVLVVPAGTGVLLVAEVPAEGEAYIIPFAENQDAPVIEGNLFVAVPQETTVAPSDPTNASANYVLSQGGANSFAAVTGEGVLELIQSLQNTINESAIRRPNII